ncbi:hypothetical protein [Ilumatobacter coccineus]|uniref:Uncharacterized protein n=1 Tax=Ilumatobacter coccineus (strain NBRC 103263 / KCTC 29153 / YM16-304) TaxID=1313172 RepID=A0A6C7E091_ILUCY|nr:hypothetical protein [Ilumatobacter coccineus]BAN00433.1 hypothetical protein YM304_01190 [Ilumatobacter coccineus YM16-304]
MPRISRALAAIALAFAMSGCIGATDRADFDAEVRARGGGLTSAWIAEALDLVAAEVSVSPTSEMQLLTLSINPPNRSMSATARRGDEPSFADSVVVSQGNVVAVSPIQNADRAPLDEVTFTVGEVALSDIESVGDEALREFGETDGFIDAITITLNNGEPVMAMSLSSARRTATARFEADGTFIEVLR